MCDTEEYDVVLLLIAATRLHAFPSFCQISIDSEHFWHLPNNYE